MVIFKIMGWATPYISKLKNGETVSFRPRGHSMKSKIESGQFCTVEPMIKAIQGKRFQIGNNRGRI
ncbi:MAG: hypothetical protein ACR2F2_13930 [Pyrinomonadaceae bacterium]